MTLERPGYKLTAEAETDFADFVAEDTVCRCHISPPCGHCTHPGNPANLEEDDSAWEPDEAVQEAPRPTRVAIGGLRSGKSLQLAAILASAGISVDMSSELLSGELGRIERTRFVKSEEVPTLARGNRPYRPTPKQPNPEIQSAAEAKRLRRQERNKRTSK